MTAPRNTRPQAKTASRRAFEARYGDEPPGASTYIHRKMWEAFHEGWRLARGAKPTVREKDV